MHHIMLLGTAGYLRPGYLRRPGRQACSNHYQPCPLALATLPKALNVEEADRLLDSAAEARKTPKRAYAIVRLALDLGLRSGGIANLNLDDVDWRPAHSSCGVPSRSGKMWFPS